MDALIVAGDLFDTGSPPSYARELYNRFVVDLQRTGCQLVVLGGNHDSVATLNESRELLSCLNTTVIASAQGAIEQQIVVLNRRDGQPGAVLCAIPFLRPRDLLTSRAGESGVQKQQALQEAIAEHYQALYQAACERRDRLGLPLPIVATGHLTTVGVTTSDSVRDIYIGTLDAFPAQAFPVPTISRWATFTARRTSPSRNIFAIAARRSRSASMNWAKPKASSWSISPTAPFSG